MADATVID